MKEWLVRRRVFARELSTSKEPALWTPPEQNPSFEPLDELIETFGLEPNFIQAAIVDNSIISFLDKKALKRVAPAEQFVQGGVLPEIPEIKREFRRAGVVGNEADRKIAEWFASIFVRFGGTMYDYLRRPAEEKNPATPLFLAQIAATQWRHDAQSPLLT